MPVLPSSLRHYRIRRAVVPVGTQGLVLPEQVVDLILERPLAVLRRGGLHRIRLLGHRDATSVQLPPVELRGRLIALGGEPKRHRGAAHAAAPPRDQAHLLDRVVKRLEERAHHRRGHVSPQPVDRQPTHRPGPLLLKPLAPVRAAILERLKDVAHRARARGVEPGGHVGVSGGAWHAAS
eukprot:scaffold57412_cov58-Phaeocystis_antarctica.AAC.2